MPWNLLCEFKIFNAMEILYIFINLMAIICTLLIKYLATHHSIQNSTVIKYLLSKVSFFNIALHTEQYNDQQFAVVHCWKIKKLTLNWEAKRPSLGRTCSRASFSPHPAGPVRRGRSMGPAQSPHMQNHLPKPLKWVPEDNHHHFACGPNIYMLNTQNAQLWCATCLKNRKPCTHTERGSWSVLHMMVPFPLFDAYYMLLP